MAKREPWTPETQAPGNPLRSCRATPRAARTAQSLCRAKRFWLTDWLPDAPADPTVFQQFLHGLRLDRLTEIIMNVFNTLGNRAIMIGIALGVVSTSLKVLLGVDRSYLGSDQE